MMRFIAPFLMLAAAPGASAQTADAPITVDAFERLPPARIGDIVLPAGHPPIALVRFGSPGPPLATTYFVYLYSAATPLGADFCTQQLFAAGVTPIPNDPKAVLEKLPAPVGAPTAFVQYRYRIAGAVCDGARTFSVDGMPADEAFAVVRAAATAATRVGKRQPLPFVATCRDMMSNCRPGDMLANADLGSILTVSRPPVADLGWQGPVARLAKARGWRFYTIEIGAVGGMMRTRIGLAMARGRIMRLSIESLMIVY